MKKRIEKSPNRIRYEQENPIFSVRLSRKLMDVVENLEKQTGKNRRDCFESIYRKREKDFADAIEKKAQENYEKRQEICDTKEYDRGFRDASMETFDAEFEQIEKRLKEIYTIDYNCSNPACKNNLHVERGTEVHWRVRNYLETQGFLCPSCELDKRMAKYFVPPLPPKPSWWPEYYPYPPDPPK